MNAFYYEFDLELKAVSLGLWPMSFRPSPLARTNNRRSRPRDETVTKIAIVPLIASETSSKLCQVRGRLKSTHRLEEEPACGLTKTTQTRNLSSISTTFKATSWSVFPRILSGSSFSRLRKLRRSKSLHECA